MTSVFIDPFLLACPSLDEGQIEYERFIQSLLDWQELATCDWASPYISSETSDVLFQLNKYPLWDYLIEANHTYHINYIPPDAVMKLVTSFLTKFTSIETLLQIEAVDYSNFSINPDFIFKRTDQLLKLATQNLLVYMVIKCRILKDDPTDQILVTEPFHHDSITTSFSLNEILFTTEQNIYVELPKHEEETFPVYQDYKDLSSTKNVALDETDISPDKKKIKLSGDHHGNKVLKDFAEKLLTSGYVVEVINNLPFNSYTEKFIYKVYENGLIDLYMTKTDKGFGMTIQTTGKNLVETVVISKILEEQFAGEQ